MGRIALFRTGRRCYHIGILMHMVRGRNVLGFFFLTTLTASLGKTCFRFRCFLHRFPFAKVMAEGIGIIANVAVAALTGKRGITLFRTGRRRYGFCVYMLMFLLGNFTGFFFTAAFAASLFQSGFFFRCFPDGSPFAEFMAEGIGISIYITVAALLTGMGRITLLRTGGSGNCFGIGMFMRFSRNFTGFFFITAYASSLFQTCFVFRCFLHRFPFTELMAERFRVITDITVSTLLTGIGRIAFFRTGGVCDNLVIFMVADSYLYVAEGSHAVCGYLNVCFAVILCRQHTVSYGYNLGIGRSIA